MKKIIIIIMLVLLAIPMFSQITINDKMDYMGIERTWITYIPANAGSSLVLLFHGHGGNAYGMINGFDFKKKADQDGIIIVAVDGVASGENSKWPLGTRGWNAYHCCGNSYETQVDDVGFISLLIDYLRYTYKVTNISAFGFSTGGMLCHRLASEMSDKISAIADVSGTVGGVGEVFPNVVKMPSGIPSEKVSIMMVHGKLDPVIFYNQDWNIEADRKDIPFEYGVQMWRNVFGYDKEVRLSKERIPLATEVKHYTSSQVGPFCGTHSGMITIVFEYGYHDCLEWNFVLNTAWHFFKESKRR
jgi:poly(3-hydroxybutyrate) depolymerase